MLQTIDVSIEGAIELFKQNEDIYYLIDLGEGNKFISQLALDSLNEEHLVVYGPDETFELDDTKIKSIKAINLGEFDESGT